jgi:ribosomal protein L5
MALFQTFKKTGKKELLKEMDKKNIHQVPQLDKVIVAM